MAIVYQSRPLNVMKFDALRWLLRPFLGLKTSFWILTFSPGMVTELSDSQIYMTPGDEDWYLMHRMKSYDWPYSKVGRDSSKVVSLRVAVLHAAVFLLQLFSLSL